MQRNRRSPDPKTSLKTAYLPKTLAINILMILVYSFFFYCERCTFPSHPDTIDVVPAATLDDYLKECLVEQHILKVPVQKYRR